MDLHQESDCLRGAFAHVLCTPGIAFLLKRRTSWRAWSTPCCKPTAPLGCRCWRATSWYVYTSPRHPLLSLTLLLDLPFMGKDDNMK